jgi:TRAP-type mannitol/chloroaromatic compound transport system substrate-binding protein
MGRAPTTRSAASNKIAPYYEGTLGMLSKYCGGNPTALCPWGADVSKLLPFRAAVLEASYNAAQETNAESSAKNPKFKKVYEPVEAPLRTNPVDVRRRRRLRQLQSDMHDAGKV